MAMSRGSSFSELRGRVPGSMDKGAIILDIGRIYTKCGLSRESAPRSIIRSQVKMKPYGQVVDVWDPKYINREELFLTLCRFIQHIYTRILMVNPRDHRVVVVESLLCPTHFRNTLARVLFNHLNVPYASFVPSHLVSTFTIARPSAIVVDVGYKETTVLPICEGIPVVSAWQSTSYAAEALYSSVKTLLLERANVRCSETGEEKPLGAINFDDVIGSAIEDIVARTCFVCPLNVEESKVPPPVEYPLNSKYTLIIEGSIRDCAANVLFVDSGDDQPIPTCIMEALMKCSIDCRKELSENILVIGGTATLPGFNYRLKQELESLMKDECQSYHKSLGTFTFKFHEPPTHPNCVAWLGGCIFGSSEVAVMERAITKDRFKETKQLPNWTSCDPTQREHLRVVPTRKLLPSAPTSSYSRASIATQSSKS